MNLEEIQKVELFFKSAATSVEISTKRKDLLTAIAHKTHEVLKHTNTTTYLNFICTHNSRRSQLAQVWSYYASFYFKLPTIKSYSGGTSVTAFHRNTVKTLKRAGFTFKISEYNHQNRKYLIKFDSDQQSLLGFSKLFDDKTNSKPYIAITTCSSANENCPFIPEAIWRFHLPFTDPKESDSTEFEEEAYLTANNQIAAEIYFLFNEIKILQAN